MTKWTSPSKRSHFSTKRLSFLFLLLFLVLYWDLIGGILRGFVLLIRPQDLAVSLPAELLRTWGRFALFAVLFLFTFALFQLLIAHFLLPNPSLEQQIELWKRLWLYLIGKHGAAVFVRDGKIVGELGEKNKKGVGLLLIDRQSAVIVEELNRHQSTQVRVYSAGVVFLNQTQKIRGSVDLRPQRRSIPDLHAYTKDGVEIVTHLSTTFTLGQEPEVLLVTYHLDQTQSQPKADSLRVIQFSDPMPSSHYTRSLHRTVASLSNEIEPDDREEIHRFVQNFHLENPDRIFTEQRQGGYRPSTYTVDPQRIMAAFYATPSSQPLQTSDAWTELPLQIVIDLFREFIASIPYESIYFPHRPFLRALSELKSQFSKRIRNQGVLAFQFVQRKDNQPIRIGDEWQVSDLIFYPVQTLNTPKFLRSKGIKILNATFGELRPADETIERKLFDQWLAGYQKQLTSPPDRMSTTPSSVEEKKANERRELANRLAETLNSPSLSDQAILTQFLAIIQAELNDPQSQQWISSETVQHLQSLRSKLLSPTRSFPSDEKL